MIRRLLARGITYLLLRAARSILRWLREQQ